VSALRLRKILCPVDFSDTSRAALRVAEDLCRQLGGAITLLHVYQAPGYTFPEGMVVAGPDVLASLVTQVEEALDVWRRDAESAGAHVEKTLAVMGSTHSEIERVAQDGGYDLIVIGTHGRTGLKHVLLGSTAEKVVRTAPCPVLTVRAPDGLAGQAENPL
jgi:nucleotide-binding universal stress UspA family protein